MFTKDFSYEYPSELIAKEPLADRSSSKMMVLDREAKKIAHHSFLDFPDYFKEGDLLIFNNTKVIPARLFATKKTGGKVEVLLIRSSDPNKNLWECLIKPGTGIQIGSEIFFQFDSKKIPAIFTNVQDKIKIVQFPDHFSVDELMRKTGGAPLPPYMGHKENRSSDLERYQTVFAEKEGAIAAPTAGLHFTPAIFSQLKEKGVQIHFVTLHVGLGTFEPVRTEQIEDHPMHQEFYEIPNETIKAIRSAKEKNRPVTAIGTTSVRALESYFREDVVPAKAGTPLMQVDSRLRGNDTRMYKTNLFIYPGYQFKIIDRLFTNFHQPESTLIMLTSAFAGKEFLFESYREAIREKYRLFSYGDCMLIL